MEEEMKMYEEESSIPSEITSSEAGDGSSQESAETEKPQDTQDTSKSKARSTKKKLFGHKSARNITKLGVLTAISVILYIVPIFQVRLSFMFPSWLELQISDLPALLAGYSMGPFAGALVIIVKCLIKMPFSSTSLIGECADILVGLAFVLPAALIYKTKKNKKGALIGLCVGSLCCTGIAVLANRFILLPYFFRLRGMAAVLGMLQVLFPKVTEATFFAYYLPLGVVPFNLLRCIIVGLLTFLLYKRLSKILHW